MDTKKDCINDEDDLQYIDLRFINIEKRFEVILEI